MATKVSRCDLALWGEIYMVGPRIQWGLFWAVSILLSMSLQTVNAQTFETQAGQPICETEDDLHTYFLAALANDKTAKWNCQLVEAGLSLEVEEVISKSAIGELIRAKVSDGSSSIEGYTMNVGLTPK